MNVKPARAQAKLWPIQYQPAGRREQFALFAVLLLLDRASTGGRKVRGVEGIIIIFVETEPPGTSKKG